jgi:hypothetical protein
MSAWSSEMFHHPSSIPTNPRSPAFANRGFFFAFLITRSQDHPIVIPMNLRSSAKSAANLIVLPRLSLSPKSPNKFRMCGSIY